MDRHTYNWVLAILIAGLLSIAGCARKPGDQAPATAAAAGESAAAESSAPGGTPQAGVSKNVSRSEVSRNQPAPDLELPAGTRLQVRLDQSLGSARSSVGEKFRVTLDQPVVLGDRVVLPQGTELRGHVTNAVPSGRLKRPAHLSFTLDTLEWQGRAYPIATSGISRAAKSHNKRNLALIGGGSGFGALVGGLASGGVGALVGAGAGAGAGTAGAFATGKKNIFIPAETVLTFRLQAPLRVAQG